MLGSTGTRAALHDESFHHLWHSSICWGSCIPLYGSIASQRDADSVWDAGSIFLPVFSVVSAQPNNYTKLSLPWLSQRSEASLRTRQAAWINRNQRICVWDLRDRGETTTAIWKCLCWDRTCWQNMNGTIDIHEFVMFFRTNGAWVSLGQWLQLFCVLEACELVLRAITGQCFWFSDLFYIFYDWSVSSNLRLVTMSLGFRGNSRSSNHLEAPFALTAGHSKKWRGSSEKRSRERRPSDPPGFCCSFSGHLLSEAQSASYKCRKRPQWVLWWWIQA